MRTVTRVSRVAVVVALVGTVVIAVSERFASDVAAIFDTFLGRAVTGGGLALGSGDDAPADADAISLRDARPAGATASTDAVTPALGDQVSLDAEASAGGESLDSPLQSTDDSPAGTDSAPSAESPDRADAPDAPGAPAPTTTADAAPAAPAPAPAPDAVDSPASTDSVASTDSTSADSPD